MSKTPVSFSRLVVSLSLGLIFFGLTLGLATPDSAAQELPVYRDYVKEKDAEERLAKLEPLAKTGDKTALFHYFEIMFDYDNNVRDFSKPMVWLKDLADQGSFRAMFYLAIVKLSAIDKKGDAETLAWLKKAAENGDIPATLMLGFILNEGLPGLKPDPAEGDKWYAQGLKADPANDLLTLKVLTYLYEDVTQFKDRAKVEATRLISAENGDPKAIVEIASSFEHEDSSLSNPVEAFKWWIKAAELGDLLGQQKAGLAFFYGQGVPVNKAEG
ncbi:MAG: sel1 repeat family protein, partial [Deltaproteobacteria bacterium]|nr:sel1 repeat family protein [Deltaproteobacteria bacterium]